MRSRLVALSAVATLAASLTATAGLPTSTAADAARAAHSITAAHGVVAGGASSPVHASTSLFAKSAVPAAVPRSTGKAKIAASRTAAAASADCTGTASAATRLDESGFTASASATSAGDPPQNALTNVVNNTSGLRYSSGAPQAAGMWYQVDLGSAKTFDTVQLAVPASPNDYAPGYDVSVSPDGTTWTPVASCTGSGATETAGFTSQSARYLRVTLTQANPAWWWSINTFSVFNNGTGTTSGTMPNLGANTYVFTPSMPQAQIQNTVNQLFVQQNTNQFGTQRYALLFMPGTYGTADNPLTVDVGYYEEVAGLGQNPKDVVINGVVNSYNQCSNGPNTCYATNNFWRSIYNLTINVDSVGTITQTPGCGDTVNGCGFDNGADFWATSQEAPLRRLNMNGQLNLMDNTSTPAWCSGGWMSDSQVGHVLNGCQQQFMTSTSKVGFWTNSLWNQAFCGTTGAPADNFTATPNDNNNIRDHYTNLATCGTTREMPYLYQSANGLAVWVPSVVTGQVGPSWHSGQTPGTSQPISQYFVASPSNTSTDINTALDAGKSILFTPGIYKLDQTLRVTKPDTKLIGLGFSSLYPSSNQTTVDVADVPGVDISGLILEGGTNQGSIVNFGSPNSTSDFSADPSTLHDDTIRVGGQFAGQAQTGLVLNQNNAQISNLWVWRADHGAGQGGDVASATVGCFTCDQLQNGLIVNGNNVNAYGLFDEHTNKEAAIWNGQGGRLVFFQNENPYEMTDQSQWMYSPTQKGYPALRVADTVNTFNGYAMGSYNYYSKGVDIHSAMAFLAPNKPGVQFTHLFTRFLNGSGSIDSVINGVGPADSATTPGPQDVVNYP
ncbi:discoidin domain-containing protein [Streptacidiphilus sp. PAMC 29251]